MQTAARSGAAAWRGASKGASGGRSGQPDCRIGQAGYAVEIGVQQALGQLDHDPNSFGLSPLQMMMAFSMVALMAMEAIEAKTVVTNVRICICSKKCGAPGREGEGAPRLSGQIGLIGNCAIAKKFTGVAYFATGYARVASHRRATRESGRGCARMVRRLTGQRTASSVPPSSEASRSARMAATSARASATHSA
jgi:hypothetical protein